MTAKGARWLWLALALTPLGCPLLIDDEFVLVEAAAGANDEAASRAGASGAPTCPMLCDSCAGSTCMLDCSGDAACKDGRLACPPGHACQLTCTGKRACEKLRLSCPPASPCSVRCEGDACKDMTVTCGTGRCEAECPGPGAGPELICGKSAACAPCP